MSHRSRLSQALNRNARSCIVCECTEDNACILKGGVPCSWVAPRLCSNPVCVAKAMVKDVEPLLKDFSARAEESF